MSENYFPKQLVRITYKFDRYERFDLFDKKRRDAEALEAEKEYLQELMALEKDLIR